MTELLTPLDAQPTEVSPRTPVLITEQEVLFATAAALPLQPVRTRRRWTDAVRAFLATTTVTSSNDGEAKARHYPSRNDYLEHSRMAREMMRL